MLLLTCSGIHLICGPNQPHALLAALLAPLVAQPPISLRQNAPDPCVAQVTQILWHASEANLRRASAGNKKNSQYVCAKFALGLCKSCPGFGFWRLGVQIPCAGHRFWTMEPRLCIKVWRKPYTRTLCMRIRIHTYIHAWLKWLKPFKLKPAVAQL